MTNLQKLRYKQELIERCANKKQPQIVAILQEYQVSLSSYHRWKKMDFRQLIDDEYAWREAGRSEQAKGLSFQELKDWLKQQGFSPTNSDLRTFLREEGMQGQRGRPPIEIRQGDLSLLKYLAKANEYNDQLVHLEGLDDYKIQRIVSLGHLYPYQPKPNQLPIRFRMDVVFLSGKWRDLDGNETPISREESGGLARIYGYKHTNDKEWKLKLCHESIGTPETHQSGIILVMLNPCLYEAKQYVHNPKPQERIPKFTSAKWIHPDLQEYQHTLPVPYIGKDILSFSFGQWNPCSNVRFKHFENQLQRVSLTDIDHTNHPFSPKNFKHTVETELESIIATRTRPFDLRSKYAEINTLEELDLEWGLESIQEYYNKFVNVHRREAPEFPNDWFQSWFEAKEYKVKMRSHKTKTAYGLSLLFNEECGFPEDKERTVTEKDETYQKRLDNSVAFHQYLNNYKSKGIHTRVLPLSLFGPFQTEAEVMRQLATMIGTVDYLPVYFQKMKEVRDIHYPDFNMPIFEPSIAFSPCTEDDNCGFIRCTVRINDETDAMLFFALGAYPYWLENQGPFIDLYGQIPSITNAEAEANKDKLIDRLLNKLGKHKDKVHVCFENDAPIFEYSTFNAAFWTEQEQAKLFDYDSEYIEQMTVESDSEHP